MSVASINEVRLVGRVSGVAGSTLPSGDEIVTFRVVTDRIASQRGPSGRVMVDTLDCVAFSAAVRRKALRLADGDWVEIVGALRRRFWRGASGTSSRTEVEVRRVSKARA
jgi:single-strand DNA-binding protein